MIAAGGAFDGMCLRRVAFPGYSFSPPAGNFDGNVPPAAHFSHQLEKWAKEPFETDGFKTSAVVYKRFCLKLAEEGN